MKSVAASAKNQSVGFSGIASEERRCFGVRAAERSVDAALVVPEEANLFDTPGGKPTLSSFSISIRFTASS
jgi:hypothetical protein